MTTIIPSPVMAPARSHVLGDPFATGGTKCAQRLHASPFNKFVVNDDETSVAVVEVASNEFPEADAVAQKTCFGSTQSLVAHCRANPAPRLRIISIPQYSSYDELEITKECLELLFEIHDVSTDFLNVLYAAGKPPRDSEEGFGQPIETRYSDGSFSLAYLSRYYGQREHAWKLRQTGVYHAYSAVNKSNIIFLLHPSKHSDFEKALTTFAMQPGSAAALVFQPTRIHAMLFEAYFDNWRAFLKEKGDSFIKGADKLFVANIEGEEYLDISFKKLQSWRELEDRIMPLASMFQALLDLLEILETVDKEYAERASVEAANASGAATTVQIESNFFASRKGPVKALMTSSAGLQQRIHGVLSLLTNTLEMRNHKQLSDTNGHLLNLQRENVEDSDTVQIITVVTLMYLPASFVATLFGMNLFGFNQETAHIRIANDFWLYVAIMLPLTFITVFYWYIRTKNSRAERKKRLQSPHQSAEFAVSKNRFQIQMQHLGQGLKGRMVSTV